MKINIKTIANLAGVSVSTVSKIINNYSDVGEETKQKVLKIMKETGYIPSYTAKTLATNKSNLVGVVFAGHINIDFTHPFFVEVLNAFKKQMGVLGYDLIFFSNEKFHQSGEDYLARCRHFQVDGCIIINGTEVEPCIYELDRSEIPCIGVDIQLSGKNSGTIMSDNYKIGAKVVEHFYLMGYRELGFIGGRQDAEISNMRKSGFLNALESFGLVVNENWFVHGQDFYEQSGFDAMNEMIRKGDLPRAVFASSDLIAIGAIRALKEQKLAIPHDIAVIGCDDIEAAKYTTPSLTTIRQDKDKIGKLAAMMLYDIMNNQLEASSVVVEPLLVVRESCGSAV